MESFLSRSPEETISVAEAFASTIGRNDIVALSGELGSGKTQFVKGVCKYFGVHELVSSPTFVMLHRYAGLDNDRSEILIYHFDLYKVINPSEVFELGYEEYFNGGGICLVEWSEKLGALMPSRRIEVMMSLESGERDRRVEVIRHCGSEQFTEDPDLRASKKRIVL